jgi:hypothetical protein
MANILVRFHEKIAFDYRPCQPINTIAFSLYSKILPVVQVIFFSLHYTVYSAASKGSMGGKVDWKKKTTRERISDERIWKLYYPGAVYCIIRALDPRNVLYRMRLGYRFKGTLTRKKCVK